MERQKTDLKPTVLIIEDEEDIVTLLRYNLEAANYQTLIARDGEEGILLAKEHLPNLILLDWMMPMLSGVEACRLLRRNEKTRQIPIIMVTARGEEADKVRALDVGADDYVTKPFSPAELIARVGAVLRRVGNLRLDAKLEVGDIVMDTAEFRVHRGDREIHVGPTEYKILKLFMQNPGKVYSREQLLNQIWGQDVYVEIRTVDVHIRRLRVALNEGGEADVIRTVRSAGYALDVDHPGGDEDEE